jgi:hypothetical protein
VLEIRYDAGAVIYNVIPAYAHCCPE